MTGDTAVVTLEYAPEEAGEYDAELCFSLTNIDPEVDSEKRGAALVPRSRFLV